MTGMPCWASQHDLALRPYVDRVAAPAVAHPDGTAALEQDLLDQHAGLEFEIRPLQHRLEERLGRRQADAALLVHVEIADAAVVAGVEVGGAWNAHLVGSRGDGVEDRPGDAHLLDPPFARAAVMLGVAEEVPVEPAEGRQHVVPAPALQSELAPMVVVGRLAAHRDHAVDRRAAADDLAARIVEGAAVQPGLRLGLEQPVGTRIAHGVEVAHGNVEPDPAIVAARLEHQHARRRIG
jgi:hypothetical protein